MDIFPTGDTNAQKHKTKTKKKSKNKILYLRGDDDDDWSILYVLLCCLSLFFFFSASVILPLLQLFVSRFYLILCFHLKMQTQTHNKEEKRSSSTHAITHNWNTIQPPFLQPYMQRNRFVFLERSNYRVYEWWCAVVFIWLAAAAAATTTTSSSSSFSLFHKSFSIFSYNRSHISLILLKEN